MKCPNCNTELRVIDTDHYDDYARRRRKCDKCGYRISTKEYETNRIDEWRDKASKYDTIIEDIRKHEQVSSEEM